MKAIKPPRLKKGNTIGVIAPATSASFIEKNNLNLAKKGLESLGFSVAYAKNAFRHESISLDSIKYRLEDVHGMFKSKKIQAIMAVIGGYTSNELLPHINYELIKSNPKIFIGYSDITSLQNAIFVKTGLVTFSGPCFASFSQRYPPFDFELNYFKKILIEGAPNIEIKPSKVWADNDEWWKHPEKKREIKRNNGWRIIKNGKSEGIIIGGNLSTFLLLLGTPYCPDFQNKIIFIEEDPEMNLGIVKRMLTQLSQIPNIKRVRGLVIGRFSEKTNLDARKEWILLRALFSRFVFPIISNVDFGHTNPMITFPIGGRCEIDTTKPSLRLPGKSVV